jgi:CubicO group peptidase (beta-lactamase class C family)
MNKKILSLPIIFIIALLTVTFAMQYKLYAEPEGNNSNTIDTTKLDNYITSEMKKTVIPGLALGIINSEEVYLKGFGGFDTKGGPITPKTPFIIGSLSKSFTAMSIMQLAESGKIELDKPVKDYIPWFSIMDKTASSKITLRNLLNQTSGISTSAGVTIQNGKADSSIEQLVRDLKTLKLTKPVGTTFQYSNINYIVLGEVIQIVSGKSYEEYIKKNIFEPLEMKHTYTSQADAIKNNMAGGYRILFGFPAASNLPYFTGGLPEGFIISCAEDMTHYLSAYINGGKYKNNSVLSEQSIAEMLKPAVKIKESQYYGMGWKISLDKDKTRIWHDGDTANFHADMIILPDLKSGFVILNNMNLLWLPLVNNIPKGIEKIVAGNEPTDKFLSTVIVNTIFSVFYAAIVFQIIWTLARMKRWRNQLKQGKKKLRKLLIPIIILDFLVPVTFLSCFPKFFGATWPIALLYLPDFSFVLIIMSVCFLIIGIIKIIFIILHLREKKLIFEKQT